MDVDSAKKLPQNPPPLFPEPLLLLAQMSGIGLPPSFILDKSERRRRADNILGSWLAHTFGGYLLYEYGEGPCKVLQGKEWREFSLKPASCFPV